MMLLALRNRPNAERRFLLLLRGAPTPIATVAQRVSDRLRQFIRGSRATSGRSAGIHPLRNVHRQQKKEGGTRTTAMSPSICQLITASQKQPRAS